MSLMNEYFANAELSFAAYANLEMGMPAQSLINALKGVGMSSAQATDFATRWRVVDQYNHSSNGFSAAVFEDISSGKRVLIVDQGSERITEDAGRGTDTVLSSVSFTLPGSVENLTLTGGGPIGAFGNALDNVLIGNSSPNILNGFSGNDVLDGGAGDDSLYGGQGDDTYVVDSAGDLVVENANINEGIDLIQSAISMTLGNFFENLTLTGTAAITGTGNTLDNVLIGNGANNTLTGNAGHDTLDGQGGADKMNGGDGDDFYVVDNVGDTVTEKANAGTDKVNSSIGFTLGSNVENLTLLGDVAINGTGNTANNVLEGNSGANVLTGNGGSDTLTGGAGNDTLIGGTGGDIYQFARGFEIDTLNDYDTTKNVIDQARFASDIASDQLWFRHVGNDLEVSVIGGGDRITVPNWYSGVAYHVERFVASDGKTLIDSKVDALVQAMAGFAPPSAGETTLPATYQQTLAPVIAANWQ